MINPLDKKEINFIGHRKLFLIISLCLVVASMLVFIFNPPRMSVEFVGGSTITYINTPENTTEDTVRDAVINAGAGDDVMVQTMSSNGVDGFLVRLAETDVQKTEEYAMASANTLGVDSSDVQSSTISPSWGASVVQSSIIAFIVGLLLILVYVAVRFKDIKIGTVAIVALLHDLIIVLGIYALVGRELTPNTIAAVLTIMGYSLYDTIVTFHSIKDNAESGKFKQNFWTIANHSINEVIVRTVNTTLSSIIPVIFMLVLGGTTLSDFAFAMVIGLIAGSYSSVALAAPLYSIWKSRELNIAKMNCKYNPGVVNTDTADILKLEHNTDDLAEYRIKRAEQDKALVAAA